MAFSKNTARDSAIREEYAEALKARAMAKSFYARMIETHKISHERIKQIVLGKARGDV